MVKNLVEMIMEVDKDYNGIIDKLDECIKCGHITGLTDNITAWWYDTDVDGIGMKDICGDIATVNIKLIEVMFELIKPTVDIDDICQGLADVYNNEGVN